jgi:LmbE family N-acetylglucosaminyl deacetylase
MHRLIEKGKGVRVAYITSGDAGVNAESRESELLSALMAIGVEREATVLLGVSEKDMLSSLKKTTQTLIGHLSDTSLDCIVGMDYEGGHEVHDGASFIASSIAQNLSLPHYVFPVYHAEDGKRIGAEFLPEHNTTDTVKLETEDVNIKIKVLEAHRGQIGHFLHLQRQSPEYFQRLFSHEIFRRVAQSMDFTERPTKEIAYEAHRNGFKFNDFEQAIKEALDE